MHMVLMEFSYMFVYDEVEDWLGEILSRLGYDGFEDLGFAQESVELSFLPAIAKRRRNRSSVERQSEEERRPKPFPDER